MPVPDNASVVVEVWVLLVNVSVPLAAPVDCGLKVTVNGAVCPARTINGNERPLKLNEELFVSAAVTVTSLPLAVRLPDPLTLVPTTTLPNPRLLGDTVSCPVEFPPVPESVKLRVGLEPSLVSVATAEKVPAAFGVNCTLKFALCPAGTEAGRVGVVSTKYLLETEALLIVTAAEPELVAVRVRVLLTPGATAPKFRAVLASDRSPVCCWPPPPVLTP